MQRQSRRTALAGQWTLKVPERPGAIDEHGRLRTAKRPLGCGHALPEADKVGL